MDYTDFSFYWINRLSFALRKEISQRFRDAGHSITPEEWAVLLVLWANGPQTPSTLSEVTIRDRTTVTRLIDGMAGKAIVARGEDPDDRRRSVISLTATGRDLEARLIPIAMELIDEVTADVSKRDLEITHKTLRRFAANLLHATTPPAQEKDS